jgi:hypothetical protein
MDEIEVLVDEIDIELFNKEDMEDFTIGTWLVSFDLFCMMIFTVFLDSPAPNLWTIMNLGV